MSQRRPERRQRQENRLGQIMNDNFEFVDYYDLLSISPTADAALVDQVFRHFAKLYHPDHSDNPDPERFHAIVEAHTVLKNPAKRAEYDALYDAHKRAAPKPKSEVDDAVGTDVVFQRKLLQLLYDRRRANSREPGIGEMHLLQMLGCSERQLDFLIWYLKEKGFIRLTEHGLLTITVAGIDHMISQFERKEAELLLTDRRMYA
jgi:curved DNA-binding protein